MIPATSHASTFHRLFLFPSVLFVLMLSASAARSQIRNPDIDTDPTSGFRRGTNTNEGQIFDSSGQPLKKRCTVRVSSVNVGEFSTMTDDNGLFTFRRLKEGTYYLKVE